MTGAGVRWWDVVGHRGQRWACDKMLGDRAGTGGTGGYTGRTLGGTLWGTLWGTHGGIQGYTLRGALVVTLGGIQGGRLLCSMYWGTGSGVRSRWSSGHS